MAGMADAGKRSWLAHALAAGREAKLSAREMKDFTWQALEVDRAAFYGVSTTFRHEEIKLANMQRICTAVGRARDPDGGRKASPAEVRNWVRARVGS